MSNELQDFVAGCAGGVLQVVSGHPLDTLKVRLQTQAAGGPQFNGMMDCLRKTVASEGAAGLYKGMSSPLVGVSFINAVLFLTNGAVQKVARTLQPDESQPLTLSNVFMCGVATGAVVSFVESPFDLFKAKLQVQYAGHEKKYNNAIDAAGKLLRTNGIRGIYQGLQATIIRNMPGNAGYFWVYELAKRKLSGGSDKPLSSMVVMSAGGIAGIGYWLFCFPLDVVKSKMQTDAVEKSQRSYRNYLDCVSKVYAKEGLGGFFRGFSPAMVRAFPANAACFLGYEYTKAFLMRK